MISNHVRLGARPWLLTALAWICLSWTCLAQTLTFPALTGRVVDEAGLFSEADRADITRALAGLETKTGDQLVVVTLKSLGGTSIEDYGYQLGRHWKIGQKDKDSGVLLIVAPNERSVRIEVGYGLEGTLTDAATKIIIETVILPRFRTGDYRGGVSAGADRIIQLLSDETGAKQAAATANVADQPVWSIILVALFAVAMLIYCVISGGILCQFLLQILYMLLSSGGGRSSGSSEGSFSGGGGSFGGGGSSGKW